MRILTKEALSCFAAANIDCVDAKTSRARFGVVQPGEVANAPRGGSSTWQSVVRGQQQIETPFLNGEICQLGRLFQIPTPANQLLLTLSLEVAAAPNAFQTRSSEALVKSPQHGITKGALGRSLWRALTVFKIQPADAAT